MVTRNAAQIIATSMVCVVALSGCPATEDRCGGIELIENGLVVVIDGAASEIGGKALVHISLGSAPSSTVTLRQQTPAEGFAPRDFQITPTEMQFSPDAFTDKVFEVSADDDGLPLTGPQRGWVLVFDASESDDATWDCKAFPPITAFIADRGCGDGLIEGSEECEPVGIENTQCTYGLESCTYCDRTCRIQAGTTHWCGDGILNATEVNGDEPCESALPVTQTCVDRGFVNGTLQCSSSCTFDESDCRNLTDVILPVVESGHMCLLDPSKPGSIRCYGTNDDGEAEPPPGTDFVDVQNGARHSCARRGDGSITCWGVAAFFANAAPGPFEQVSLGAEHTCGRRADGTAACWGENANGQTNVPEGATVLEIAAGAFHTCALHDDNTVSCWGLDGLEQASAPPGQFLSVVAGLAHTCALDFDHRVTCWGRPDALGAATPTATFVALTASGDHTCAVDDVGFATCWGGGFSGVIPLPDEPLHGLSLNDNSGCGLAVDNTLRCWGVTDVGHPEGTFLSVDARAPCALRTDGQIVCWSHPQQLPNSTPPAGTFTALSATFTGGCALRPDRHAVCFRNERFNAGFPPLLPPPSSFQSIVFASAGNLACGLLDDGSPICFGDNSHGQLDVPPFPMSKLAVDGFMNCGLRTSGELVCWGGLLGSGGESLMEPPPSGTFTDLAVGGFACGVRTTGELACWAEVGSAGVEVPAGNDFVAVTIGREACATRRDGSLVCFGRANEVEDPTRLPDGTYQSIQTGWNEVCGTTVDDSVRCLGAVSSALKVFTGLEAVAAAGSTTCLIRSDHSSECWSEADGLFLGPTRHNVSQLVTDGDEFCFIDTVTGLPRCSAGIVGTPTVPVIAIGLANHRPCALTAPVEEDAIADPPVIGSPGGDLICWNNAGDVDGSFRPAAGLATGPFQFLGVGPRHVCASSAGDVSCFGQNDFGQSTPTIGRFNALAAVDDVTCGTLIVGSNRSIKCWGDGRFGLGPITNGRLQTSIVLGPTTGCSGDELGGVTCFGAIAVPPQSGTSAAVGNDHVCIVDSTRALQCFGNARYGVSTSN